MRTPSVTESWGPRVRARRTALGLSADDLALILSVDKTTVYRWETGSMIPHPDSLKAIADALGVVDGRDLFPLIAAGAGESIGLGVLAEALNDRQGMAEEFAAVAEQNPPA